MGQACAAQPSNHVGAAERKPRRQPCATAADPGRTTRLNDSERASEETVRRPSVAASDAVPVTTSHAGAQTRHSDDDVIM